MKKLWLCLFLVLCTSCASNINPPIAGNLIGTFFSINSDQLSVLYDEFAKNNDFTDEEKKILNDGVASIEKSKDYLNHIAVSGGIDYQTMKVVFTMGSYIFDQILPILDKEANRATSRMYPDGETLDEFVHSAVVRALYFAMRRDCVELVAGGNAVIKSAEETIEQQQLENLAKMAGKFYETLSPILL